MIIVGHDVSTATCEAGQLPSPLEQFLAVRRWKYILGGNWQPGWGHRRQFGGLPKGIKDLKNNFDKHAPNFNIGKEKGPGYDPSWGYEAYWADGNWVMTSFSNLTLDINDFCNKKCSPLHISYGVICGRNRDGEYRTFENYCKMAGLDCPGYDGWTVIYQGACMSAPMGAEDGDIRVRPTQAKAQPSIKNMIIEQFYKKYGKGVGGGVANGTTKQWTYRPVFTDYRKMGEKRATLKG